MKKFEAFQIISSGTLRPTDLIDAMARSLLEVSKSTEIIKRMHECIGYTQALEASDSGYSDPHLEWLDEAFEELSELMNDYAPPFCYFGAHEGNGSDYGFWPIDEIEEDGKVIEVKDHAPEYILVINERGNRSLYQVELEEVWSQV